MNVNQNNLEFINNELKKKKMIVAFIAHWCHHCKELLPTWYSVIQKLKNKKSNVIILTVPEEFMGQLNCDTNIRGFPTIRVFKSGKKMLDYNGPRDEKHLEKFILSHLKDKRNVKSRKRKINPKKKRKVKTKKRKKKR